MSLKKVALFNWNTSFIRGNLVMKGCVKNVGTHDVDNVYLDIRIINNALGKAKDLSNGRPNTINFELHVAKNLSRGVTKCFTKKHPYPPYFRLALPQKELSWD